MKNHRVRGRFLLLLLLAGWLSLCLYLIRTAPNQGATRSTGSWLSGDHRRLVLYSDTYGEDPYRVQISIRTVDLETGELESLKESFQSN